MKTQQQKTTTPLLFLGGVAEDPGGYTRDWQVSDAWLDCFVAKPPRNDERRDEKHNNFSHEHL